MPDLAHRKGAFLGSPWKPAVSNLGTGTMLLQLLASPGLETKKAQIDGGWVLEGQ